MNQIKQIKVCGQASISVVEPFSATTLLVFIAETIPQFQLADIESSINVYAIACV